VGSRNQVSKAAQDWSAGWFNFASSMAVVARTVARTVGTPGAKAIASITNATAEIVTTIFLNMTINRCTLPDLAKETEGAPQLARMTADPFLDRQTREAIDAVKRPVLVIAGFATEAVVLHAALSALESDYRVQVPVDACGGLSARTEDAAFRQIEAAGGVMTSVVSLVTAMAPDFAQEPGRNTFAALQALRLA
jgi:Isochorismatase family